MSLAEPVAPPRVKPTRGRKRPYLERLVINVSHDCNLRCTYCYADTGAYGAPRMRLEAETGREIVETFFSRFREIGTIQFFGGEPLMNWKGVERLCQDIEEVRLAEGAPAPKLTMSSNGSIVTPPILEMLRRYQISVTVSLDGDSAMNDAQRVYPGGGGSWERVVANILWMKAEVGQPSQIEGTYTRRHLDAGFDIAAFLRFCARELDVHQVHMPWIVGDGYDGSGIAPTEENVGAVTAAYCAAATASLESLTTPDLRDIVIFTPVDSALRRAVTGQGGVRTHLCPAGSGTLAVGADGKVSPCFMFTNKPEFEFTRIGEGFDDGAFDASRDAFVRKLELGADRRGEEFEMGGACAGQNYDVGGAIDAVGDGSRRIQAALDAHVHAELTRLQADPDVWSWVRTKIMLDALSREGPQAEAC